MTKMKKNGEKIRNKEKKKKIERENLFGISYNKMKKIEENEKIQRTNTKLKKSKENIFLIISYKKIKKMKTFFLYFLYKNEKN